MVDAGGGYAFAPQLSITPTPNPVNLGFQVLRLVSVPCLPPAPLEETRLAISA